MSEELSSGVLIRNTNFYPNIPCSPLCFENAVKEERHLEHPFSASRYFCTYVGVTPAGRVVRDGDQVFSVLQRPGLDRGLSYVGVGGRLGQEMST